MRVAKHLSLAGLAIPLCLCALKGQQPAAQGKTLTTDQLEKARDYLDGKVTYWMLSRKQQADSLGRADLSSLKSLDTADPRNAESADRMVARMKAHFGNAAARLTGPIGDIDVRPYAGLPPERFAHTLTDTAVDILVKAYGPGYAPPMADRNEWEQAMTAFLAPVPVAVSPAVAPAPQKGRKSAPGPFFSFTVWDLILICACLALGYFVRKQQQALRALRRPARTDQRRGQYDDKISDANAAINRLQAKVTDLEKKLARSQPGRPEKGQAPEPKPAPPPPPRPISMPGNVFYMTLPVGNYFMAKTESPSSDNTVYKFVRKSDREAEFTVHASGPQLRDILSMADSYLRPACNEENVPKAGVKAIRTLSPGRAILEGERWIIKTKAFIRYE